MTAPSHRECGLSFRSLARRYAAVETGWWTSTRLVLNLWGTLVQVKEAMQGGERRTWKEELVYWRLGTVLFVRDCRRDLPLVLRAEHELDHERYNTIRAPHGPVSRPFHCTLSLSHLRFFGLWQGEGGAHEQRPTAC